MQLLLPSFVCLSSLLHHGSISFLVTDHTGQNVDVTEAMIPNLTKADIARRVYGSKLELTAWYSYTALIWCMKFTMLFF